MDFKSNIFEQIKNQNQVNQKELEKINQKHQLDLLKRILAN